LPASPLVVSGFTDAEAAPAVEKTISHEDLIFEERVEKELHPLDAYPVLPRSRRREQAPEEGGDLPLQMERTFLPHAEQGAFMARLRIPVTAPHLPLRELANVAKELTTGYVAITPGQICKCGSFSRRTRRRSSSASSTSACTHAARVRQHPQSHRQPHRWH